VLNSDVLCIVQIEIRKMFAIQHAIQIGIHPEKVLPSIAAFLAGSLVNPPHDC